MRIAMLLLMVFIAPVGNAQQVYKCMKGKDVSYQSAPCDGTQRMVRQWDAAPQPELAPSARGPRHSDIKRELDEVQAVKHRRTGRRSKSVSSISPDDARCNTAKARRQAKLESVGFKRTFDLLRRLDDAVYEACK